MTQVIVHPNIDLAILKVRGDDVGRFQARPISIDVDGLTALGDLIQIAGFGLTRRDGFGDRRFAVSRVLELSEAAVRVYAEGRAAACSGDSGGPALIRNSVGSVVVTGILSGGNASCADSDEYVRLAIAREWLAANGIRPEAAPAALADCRFVGFEGRCFGTAALWCEEATLNIELCQSDTSCGFSIATGGFRCVSPDRDPCLGVTDRGRCEGDYRLHCRDGELVSEPCTACNGACQTSVQSGAVICNSAESR